MSIRKYIAYLRTVETGSITQAANELGYTQSAVSKMISDLEQDWQVKLLTRNHSGIEISSDGMVLLPTIREIVKDYEDLNFAVSELHGVQSGTLRLGCFTSLAISLLPEILKDFHQTYPNIQIQLMTGEYYEISEWLRRGAIDCGFLAIPASNDFETTTILHDTMVAILPKDHPMADASVFPLEQLPHENFVRLMEIEDYDSTVCSTITTSIPRSPMTRRATSRSCPWSRRDLASASCTACSSSPDATASPRCRSTSSSRARSASP